eukprot:14523342-Alexandrium_andersonii.AAC.1
MLEARDRANAPRSQVEPSHAVTGRRAPLARASIGHWRLDRASRPMGVLGLVGVASTSGCLLYTSPSPRD